jgi:hypothetical protein
MQQSALNTNRISIRGIGSRAQYGTQNKAYYEGIPLTTAEGSSTIEDIDMEIGSIGNHQRTYCFSWFWFSAASICLLERFSMNPD